MYFRRHIDLSKTLFRLLSHSPCLLEIFDRQINKKIIWVWVLLLSLFTEWAGVGNTFKNLQYSAYTSVLDLLGITFSHLFTHQICG